MIAWEYRKIALNQLPRKVDDIDLLCEVGLEGWELVAILANNMAYLKRQAAGAPASERTSERECAAAPAGDVDVHASDNTPELAEGNAVKPKYRDPETGETWSGRGRMANWLKSKRDAGANIEDYLV